MRRYSKCSGRRFFLGSVAAGLMSRVAHCASGNTATVENQDCPRCGGVERGPLKEAQPLRWVEGGLPPKSEAAIGEEACPMCSDRTTLNRAALITEAKERIDKALANHTQWEDRTGWKLLCVITRHATLHTQLNAAQAKSAGTALETL